MVATSIGEEGLDIGEVDLIICYDSQSSSIRLVRKGERNAGLSHTPSLPSSNVWDEPVAGDRVTV